MRYISGLILVSAALVGCDLIPPATGSIEWDPPVLSKEGCPDLTGRYKWISKIQKNTFGNSYISNPFTLPSFDVDEDNSTIWHHASSPLVKETYSGPVYTERIEKSESEKGSDKPEEGLVFSIKQLAGSMIIDTHYKDFIKRDTIKLYYSMNNKIYNGCHDGSFISRFVKVRGGGDAFTGGYIHFGQMKTQKQTDGSLLIIYSFGGAGRSLLTGQAKGKLGPLKQMSVSVYPSSE